MTLWSSAFGKKDVINEVFSGVVHSVMRHRKGNWRSSGILSWMWFRWPPSATRSSHAAKT